MNPNTSSMDASSATSELPALPRAPHAVHALQRVAASSRRCLVDSPGPAARPLLYKPLTVRAKAPQSTGDEIRASGRGSGLPLQIDHCVLGSQIERQSRGLESLRREPGVCSASRAHIVCAAGTPAGLPRTRQTRSRAGGTPVDALRERI